MCSVLTGVVAVLIHVFNIRALLFVTDIGSDPEMWRVRERLRVAAFEALAALQTAVPGNQAFIHDSHFLLLDQLPAHSLLIHPAFLLTHPHSLTSPNP